MLSVKYSTAEGSTNTGYQPTVTASGMCLWRELCPECSAGLATLMGISSSDGDPQGRREHGYVMLMPQTG